MIISSDFKTWPSEGGLLDQDEAMFNDMASLLMLYHRRKPTPSEEKAEDDDTPTGPPSYLHYL